MKRLVQEDELDAAGSLAKYETYEDYLNTQVSDTDLFYLEDEAVARHLVELRYRGSGETLKRDEFETRKIQDAEKLSGKEIPTNVLTSSGKDLSAYPLLQALADREEHVRSGKLSCIIFIRDRKNKGRGQEVSGYIDYAQRLKSEPFEEYFDLKKRLMPKPSDLSYFNWESYTSTSNSSSNFQVIPDGERGLVFKNKRDRKIIIVDPKLDPGDNSTRTEIQTEEYIQVVIFDHMMRRKN